MVAISSHSLIPAGPVERRPAMWPWLVMPLVTLAMFFALFRLHQRQDAPSFDATPESSASTPFASANP